MRVRECQWPPELVVQWLCTELDARGIPGSLYARTLLSLLHPHYCPHCHPNTPYHPVKSSSVTAPAANQCAAHHHSGLDAAPLADATSRLDSTQEHLTYPCQVHELLIKNSKVDRDSLCLKKSLAHGDRRCVEGKSSSPTNLASLEHRREGKGAQTPAKDSVASVASKLISPTTGLRHATECSPATTPELLLEDEEELLYGHGLHPDADLPLAPHPRTPRKNQPSQNKECWWCNAVSRRSRKRHKRNSKERQWRLPVDHAHLHSALYLLASAADQDCEDVPELLYALCSWLEELGDDSGQQHLGAKAGVAPPPGPPLHAAAIEQRCCDAGADAAVSGGADTSADARRYFKVFPPLSRDSERAANEGDRGDAVWCTTKENTSSDVRKSPPRVDVSPPVVSSVPPPAECLARPCSSVQFPETESFTRLGSEEDILRGSCLDGNENSNVSPSTINVNQDYQGNEISLVVSSSSGETLIKTDADLPGKWASSSYVIASNPEFNSTTSFEPYLGSISTAVNSEKKSDQLSFDVSDLFGLVASGATSHSNLPDLKIVETPDSFATVEHVEQREPDTYSSSGKITQVEILGSAHGCSDGGFHGEHNATPLLESCVRAKLSDCHPLETASSFNSKNGDSQKTIAVISTNNNFPREYFTFAGINEPQSIASNVRLNDNSGSFQLFSSPVDNAAVQLQRMGSVEFVNDSGLANLTDESKLADRAHVLGTELLEREAEVVEHSILQRDEEAPVQSSTRLIDRWSAFWNKPGYSDENLSGKDNWPPQPSTIVNINLDVPSSEDLKSSSFSGAHNFDNSSLLCHPNPGLSSIDLASQSSCSSQEKFQKGLPYTDTILSEVKEKLEVLNILDTLSKKYASHCVAYTGALLNNLNTNNGDANHLPIFVHGCGMESSDSMPSATQPVVVGHAPALVIGDFTVFMPVHSQQNAGVNRTSDDGSFLAVSEKLNLKNFGSPRLNTDQGIGNNHFQRVSYPSQQSCVDSVKSIGAQLDPKLPLHEFSASTRPNETGLAENVMSSRESSEDRTDFEGSLADDEDEAYHPSRKIHQSQLEFVSCNNQNAAVAQLNNKTLTLMEMQLQMLKAPDEPATRSSEWEWQNQTRTIEQEQRAMFKAAQEYSRCKPNENLSSSSDANLSFNPLAENVVRSQNDQMHEKFSGYQVSPNSRVQGMAITNASVQEPHLTVADSLQKNFERNYFIPIGPSQSLAYQNSHAMQGDCNNDYSSVSSRSDVLEQIVPSPEMDEAWRRLRESYSNPFDGPSSGRVDVPVEKNIWADLNANNIPSSCVSSATESGTRNTAENVSQVAAHSLSNDEEQNLCRTFQSLGLEKIWDSPQVVDDKSKMRQQMLLASSLLQQQQSNMTMWTPDLQQQQKCSQSSALTSNEPAPPASVSGLNPTLVPPDNVVAADMSRSSMGLFMASKSLTDQDKLPIAGPSGMQAVLSRSSHSNFSSVVPRRTNTHEAAEYLKANALSSDPYRSRATENLLTSPRTHFRPIKSQEEQTTTNPSTMTFTTTATQVQLDLPYQRSNSGTLFLEKDAMEGSPKKYMVYKEPIEKTWEQTHNSFSNQEASLVPKFKVVKNEKFCQTEDLGNDSWSKKASSGSTPLLDSDDDNDVFAFQEEDALPSSAYQWNKQDGLPATSAYWRDAPQSSSASARSWVNESGKFSFADGGKLQPTDFVVDKLNNVAINWSEGSPNRIVFRRRSSKPHVKDDSASPEKQDRVIDTPAARAIWSSDPRTSVTASTQRYHQAAMVLQNIDPAIKALWSNSPDKTKLAPATTESSDGCSTWRKTQAFSDAGEAFGSSSRLPAWTMKGRNGGSEIGRQIPTEWTSDLSLRVNEQESQGSNETLTPLPCSNGSWNTNAEGISLISADGSNKNANKEKIWCSEAAGAIARWSADDGVPSSVWSSADDSVPWSKAGIDALWKKGPASVRDWSNGDGGVWSEEEILKARWARKEEQNSDSMWTTAAEVDDLALLEEAKQWEKDVSMNMTGADSKQEDLEDLDPGWQFQEGFVWAPQCGNTALLSARDPAAIDCEDFDDTASLSSCSSSSSSSEVVMMPTGDGGTLAVQVEYLDEELYDKIFGAPDLQMAGSLPDLPNNQAGLKVLRERWLPPWRRPCTFFMEGTCRRKHCKFSHDLSTITCRFWQEGSCLKGTECPFLHGYPMVTRRRNRSEGDSRGGDSSSNRGNNGGLRKESKHRTHRLSSFELSSETDFPSLGSTGEAKESERGDRSSANVTASQQQSQQKKKTKCTPITAAILQSSNSTRNRSRRRRHTHSAQRSSSPEAKGEAACSRSIGSTVITAGSSAPQRRDNCSVSKDAASSAEQNGSSALPSTSAGRKAEVKPGPPGAEGSVDSGKTAKQRHRRHRSKAAALAAGRKDSRDDFSSDD